MKFVLKLPSLEQMTLVKIVALMWVQNDVRALIGELRVLLFLPDVDSDANIKKIKDRITEKVSQLLLPEELKRGLLGFIMPIGLQIIDWVDFHRRGFNFGVEDRPFCPAELCWTAHGTVDRKRTAEVLVRKKNLDIATRYRLACIYCLEGDIKKLWYEMPEILKETFSRFEKDFAIISNREELVFFWTCNIKKGGLGNVPISYKDEFKLSVDLRIKIATEYFLRKLTPQEREQSLEMAALSASYNQDVFCLLLSELDEEKQMEIFKNIPHRVLRHFLNWPLQSFFIEIADRVWDILSIEDFRDLLYEINNKIEYGYRDCNYKMLFSEFWQRSPSALRSVISHEFYTGCRQSILFTIKDKGILRLIFKDATFPEKKKLFYSVNAQEYYYRLICDDRWDLLECFIKECLPTRYEMMKFKAEFEERSQKYEKWKPIKSYMEREKQVIEYVVINRLMEKKHKWDQLFQMSDDSICLYNKRNISESESCSSKRQYSMQ